MGVQASHKTQKEVREKERVPVGERKRERGKQTNKQTKNRQREKQHRNIHIYNQ